MCFRVYSIVKSLLSSIKCFFKYHLNLLLLFSLKRIKKKKNNKKLRPRARHLKGSKRVLKIHVMVALLTMFIATCRQYFSPEKFINLSFRLTIELTE